MRTAEGGVWIAGSEFSGTGERHAGQHVFTGWDPSAGSDRDALLDVFDTDHDGSLDAGIALIALTQTSVTQSFADGSSIDGESAFARTGGTTGTAASVTYAAEADGYAVQTTTTAIADGSTTVGSRALNADGSFDDDTTSTTTAADGDLFIRRDITGGVDQDGDAVVELVSSGTCVLLVAASYPDIARATAPVDTDPVREATQIVPEVARGIGYRKRA